MTDLIKAGHRTVEVVFSEIRPDEDAEGEMVNVLDASFTSRDMSYAWWRAAGDVPN